MLAKEDLIKYPFTSEALRYLGVEELTLEELVAQGVVTTRTIDAAVKRIREALDYGEIHSKDPDANHAIASFLLSLIIVASVGDAYLTKRFGIAEAKRVYRELLEEPLDKIVALGQSSFHLDLEVERPSESFRGETRLNFFQYAILAGDIPEPMWKPVNRRVVEGRVALRKHEIARLMEEGVKRRLLTIARPPATLPSEVAKAVNDTRSYVEPVRRRFRPAEEYHGPTIADAFPPCMRALLNELYGGRSLSHHGRFAITTFLLRTGRGPDDVVELFRRVADFNERMTRYQTEHLAGQRGGRTKYTPPSCKTMKSVGLCVNPDDLCARIRHPLTYYNARARGKTGASTGIRHAQ